MAMWSLGRRAAASRSLTVAFEEGGEGLASRIADLADAGDADAEGFRAELEAFLLRFGARGPNEWETRSQTWETHPDLALAAVDRMRVAGDGADPVAQQRALAADRQRLGAELLSLVAGDAEAHAQLEAALRAATLFMAGRERSKTNAIKLVHEARVAMHELGRRMVGAGHFEAPGSYGMLMDDELEAFVSDPASMAIEVARREADYGSLYDVVPPFVFDGSPPPVSQWERRGATSASTSEAGDVLSGMPGCPGAARGRARVVLSPYDAADLDPGDVLVAPLTDPSWTPLFVPAAAVVVDVGAPLSHAIIVSRELGIPCAVSVTDATKRIPDGALVEVDGTAGTVTVLEV
jgi:pyruvate,water dikinase